MPLQTVKLPRLRAMVSVTSGDKASPAFANFWDQFASQIEDSVNGVIAAQNAAAAAQASADDAQAAATAAMGAANTAQTAANAVTSTASLSNSYVTGCGISATDTGAAASITISNHTRVYGDGSSVAVTGGSLPAAYATAYWIYYDQPSRAGGVVAYALTTTSADAFPTATNPNRHFVGAITTPGSGDPDTTGNPAVPPTYVGP